MAGACCCGRRRYVVGGGVAAEDEQGHAHALGYPARPEVACGGAATIASSGDGSGSDDWAAPVAAVTEKGAQEGRCDATDA